MVLAVHLLRLEDELGDREIVDRPQICDGVLGHGRLLTMGTLTGFPLLPAMLRCRQSRQAPHAI